MLSDRFADFDRMIAEVERAAAVKALREAADRLSDEFPQSASPSIGFEAAIVESLTSVRAFADRIENGESA
jgi:hypothetical protein